jgi:hypothetical protein
VDRSRRTGTPIRLALRCEEAAAALGVSDDFFRASGIAAELRWVRRGRVRVVAVTELQRWLDENGEQVLGTAA